MSTLKIIDFYTKRTLEEISSRHFAVNDEVTSKRGIYLGCLKPLDTKYIREMISVLELKNEQINLLKDNYETLHNAYLNKLNNSLSYLDNTVYPHIELDKNTVMISEDGHTWIIPNYVVKDED